YTDRNEFDLGVKSADLMRQYGCDRDVKSVDECVAIEPAIAQCRDKLAGGIYTASDEQGDADKFTVALTNLAEARGVRFRYGIHVDSLIVDGDTIRGVRLFDEEHIPEDLIVDGYVAALGSYTPLVLAGLGIPCNVYPAKGYSATISVGAHH